MNFQDLYRKIQAIDEGTVQECGDMMPRPPAQQDNVNMNVTMSGNGAGGIKDLMNILKNIETGGEPHSEPHGGDTVVIGGDEIADVERDLDDSYNNEPNPEVAGVGAVTPTGNDLASKGDEAEKANGGGNPWNQTEVSEALVQRLAQHYQTIKNEGADEYSPGIEYPGGDPRVSYAPGATSNPQALAAMNQRNAHMNAMQLQALDDMKARMQKLQAQDDEDSRAWFAKKEKEFDARIAQLKASGKWGARTQAPAASQGTQPAVRRAGPPAGYQDVSGMHNDDW